MSRITCHECRERLVAYVNGELSARTRRQMAQHLDQCAACYSLYIDQRHLAQDLRADLTLIGQPTHRQLSHLWTAIQTDMRRANPMQPRFRRRYGIAVLVLLLALLLPWSFNGEPLMLALSLQNEPRTLSAEVTPSIPVTQQTIALRATAPRIPPAETPNAPTFNP